MTTQITDTFTGAPGVAIANHVPDTSPPGTAWTAFSAHQFIAPSGARYTVGASNYSELFPVIDSTNSFTYEFSIDTKCVTNLYISTHIIALGSPELISLQLSVETAGAGSATFSFEKSESGGGLVSIGDVVVSHGVRTVRYVVDENGFTISIDGVEQFSDPWAIPLVESTELYIAMIDNCLDTIAPLGSRNIWVSINGLFGDAPPVVNTFNLSHSLTTLANFTRPINPFGIPRPKKV